MLGAGLVLGGGGGGGGVIKAGKGGVGCVRVIHTKSPLWMSPSRRVSAIAGVCFGVCVCARKERERSWKLEARS